MGLTIYERIIGRRTQTGVPLHLKPMENIDGQLIDPDLLDNPLNAVLLRMLWAQSVRDERPMWIAE